MAHPTVAPIMHVPLLDADEAVLEDRRRRGADTRDELWEGVLHMVPPASYRHNRIQLRLAALLLPIATDRGLDITIESGHFEPGRPDNYRVPDVMIAHLDHVSDRGVEGVAPAVIEVRSPGDESLQKVPYYLRHGVGEVVVIDRDTLEVQVFRLTDGEPARASDTVIRCLEVRLERVGDDVLHLTWPDGQALLDLR